MTSNRSQGFPAHRCGWRLVANSRPQPLRGSWGPRPSRGPRRGQGAGLAAPHGGLGVASGRSHGSSRGVTCGTQWPAPVVEPSAPLRPRRGVAATDERASRHGGRPGLPTPGARKCRLGAPLGPLAVQRRWHVRRLIAAAPPMPRPGAARAPASDGGARARANRDPSRDLEPNATLELVVDGLGLVELRVVYKGLTSVGDVFGSMSAGVAATLLVGAGAPWRVTGVGGGGGHRSAVIVAGNPAWGNWSIWP